MSLALRVDEGATYEVSRLRLLASSKLSASEIAASAPLAGSVPVAEVTTKLKEAVSVIVWADVGVRVLV
jgi:hypothetical protein